MPQVMRIGVISEDQRDPKCAIKYKVTLNQEWLAKLAAAKPMEEKA